MGNLSQCCHAGLVPASERSSDGLVSNGIKKQRRMKLFFGQDFRSHNRLERHSWERSYYVKINLKYLYLGIGKP